MSRVLLVRHGQSEWNAAGRWQGQADPPLTELGRRQAANAAELVGAVDVVVCSDLDRARQTAEVMAGRLGIGPVVADAGWRERDAGEWSGLTRDEIHRHWPGYLHDDPARLDLRPTPGTAERRPPGWEPDDLLLDRSLAALGRAASAARDGTALVVTHGGVIYNLEHHLGTQEGRLANLSGRIVEIDGDGRATLGPRLTLIDHEPITAPVSEEQV